MNVAEITEGQIKERALTALQVVDSTRRAELSLHKIAFFHTKGNTRIVIELDKESDPYGSVNLGECETFARTLRDSLDELEKTSAITLNYTLEVSSAGAERELRNVQDVRRFSALPLNVTFATDNGKVYSEVMKAETFAGETVGFRLADCKTNRKKYSPKKLREAQAQAVQWSNIRKIRLHLDM